MSYSNILKPIENLLDKFTMYQVMISTLLLLNISGVIMSGVGYLTFDPLDFVINSILISLVGVMTHMICVKLFKGPNSIQSTTISLLILNLIIWPYSDIKSLTYTILITFIAIASKYILVFRGRHIFNPVAIAIFLAAIPGFTGVSWWAGSRYTLPLVLITSLIVLIKLRQLDAFFKFILYVIVIHSTFVYFYGSQDINAVLANIDMLFISYPIIFFGAYMLTEPNGIPGTKTHIDNFLAITAIPFSISYNIAGVIYSTPELALLIGNLYTTLFTGKAKYIFTFINKTNWTNNIVEYNFTLNRKLKFKAGQYLEWTLDHDKSDSRGIKRVFSISSSPLNENISFAIKHVDNQSSYKNALANMQPGQIVYGGNLGGDFIPNPKDNNVYLAGGIGITPFISILREQIKNKTPITATLIYCVRDRNEIAFRDIINHAILLGLKAYYVYADNTITDTNNKYEFVGYFSSTIYRSVLNSNTNNNKFYISGPSVFVNSAHEILTNQGVKHTNIITDYFSGL